MLDENLKVFERNKERNGVFEFGASSEQRGCYVPDLSNETLEEKSIHENQHGCTQPIIVRRARHQSDSTRSGHKFKPFDHFDNRLRTFREDIEEFLHRQPSLLQHDHINRTSGRSIEMVLRREYETEYGLCIISFDVSIITIAILKFIQYIGIFRDRVSFGHALLKKYTTVKGILLIWSSCIISLAISLHIYDYFEEDMPDIYICITIMFITMPLIISLSIDALTIYELTILKEIEGSWRMDELRHYIMLGESIN